jgi:hypothetical protein
LLLALLQNVHSVSGNHHKRHLEAKDDLKDSNLNLILNVFFFFAIFFADLEDTKRLPTHL